MKLKKGDNVMMLSGKDRGRTGKVLHTNPKEHRVLVEGLNLVKRHLRPKAQGKAGQIVSIERWVSAAAVGYVSKDTKKPSRIGWQVNADASKTRIDRKSKLPI